MSRSQNNDALFPIVIIVGSAAWMHRVQLVHIAYIPLGILGCLLIMRLCWKFMISHRFTRLHDIDSMDGLDFERYVAELISKNGFRNVSLTEKYDFGVDIIAEKGSVRWGIQAKRSSGLVKAEAVRQVVTGLRLYGCDQAMVITNSAYSAVAQRLAAGNDCVLVDRAGLKRLNNTNGRSAIL